MKTIKLILALFASIFCLYSCESTMNNGAQSEIDLESKEMSISESTIDMVLSFVKEIYPQKYKTLSLTKEVLKPEFVTNVSYEKSKFFAPTVDNTNRELDTLISIINFGDNEGFAVISTKDNQILAVTECGDLTVDDLTMDYTNEDFENNPKAVISNYISNYIVVPPGPMIPSDSINMGYVVHGPWVTETQIEPLVLINLHQNDPYNRACIDSLGNYVYAGCAPIAIIQMMSANKYPSTIGIRTSNWNSIIERYQTQAMYKRILYEWIGTIGEQCNIDYYHGESGCGVFDIIGCLSLYPRYTNINIVDNPSYDNVYPMLNNGTPLIYLGWEVRTVGDTIDTIGHAWVVDGCIYQKQSIQLYDHNHVLTGEVYDTRDYVHCNWGWNGNCNGYYYTNVFNLNNGAEIPDENSAVNTNNLNLNYLTIALKYNLLPE